MRTTSYKPGYKTSEFWFTLVSFLFSGLFLLGIIGEPAQKEELISNVTHAVESCILIGGQLTILWQYIKSRKEVKQRSSVDIPDPPTPSTPKTSPARKAKKPTPTKPTKKKTAKKSKPKAQEK